MEIRKSHLPVPWPPNDRHVGVVLVAHSMGGFVAADALFRILSDRAASDNPAGPMFPLIQGILAFDTPFNGLARSMFVYGAFSNYSKVSSVFNVMTAMAAAAPASIARLGLKQSAAARRAARPPTTTTTTSSPAAAFATWQLVAVKTGTVGAIAAGGVAAYMHRRRILEGLSSVRNNLNRDAVVQGYQSSVDALGHGLAYINRGNVGKSFAWLAEHFTFVGALLRQKELARRLDRMAALRGGVGIADVYASMGENGYWSGGYFVPERTFCAVPAKDQPAAALFVRQVMEEADDEIQAHMGLFKKEKNKGYETMTSEAAKRVVLWFRDETEVWDDPRFALAPSEPEEEEVGAEPEKEAEGELHPGKVAGEAGAAEPADGGDIPDESPIDIAAAASLVPLPDDIEADITAGDGSEKSAAEKQAYMRYLFGVAQQTGTNLKSYLPSKMPTMESMSMPKVSMPVSMPNVSMPSVSMPNVSMPSVSMPNVSMPSVSMPSVSLFGKKSTAESGEVAPEQTDEKKESEMDEKTVCETHEKKESEMNEKECGTDEKKESAPGLEGDKSV